jgi:hypothetical protein
VLLGALRIDIGSHRFVRRASDAHNNKVGAAPEQGLSIERRQMYRRGVFTKEVIDDLRVIFAGVCLDFEAQLVEFDGEDDHVHLLVNYPPKVALSALVNSLKGVSTHDPQEELPERAPQAVGWRAMVAVLLRR